MEFFETGDAKKEFFGTHKDELKLVWHGTTENGLKGICENGFDNKKCETRTDAGFLGKGHYFSREKPEQAMRYIENLSEKVCAT